MTNFDIKKRSNQADIAGAEARFAAVNAHVEAREQGSNYNTTASHLGRKAVTAAIAAGAILIGGNSIINRMDHADRVQEARTEQLAHQVEAQAAANQVLEQTDAEHLQGK